MDYFSAEAMSWLPTEPTRPIPGTLSFAADGVTVNTHAALFDYEDPAEGQVGVFGPEEVAVPTVLGRLHDDRQVTLLNVSGTSIAGPFESVHELWRADFLLTGGHTRTGIFASAWFDFDALLPWSEPPSIAIEERGTHAYRVDPARQTLVEGDYGTDTKFRLVTGGAGKMSGHKVDVEQWCQFQVQGPPTGIHAILDSWVRPLEDLLIVCLGRSLRMNEMFLLGPEANPRDGSFSLYFPAVQPQPGPPITWADLRSYGSSALITRTDSPIPVQDLVSGWLKLRKRCCPAITQICGPFHAPFMYSEHRYSSIFQSAEALARDLFETRQKTPAEHRSRVENALTVLTAGGLDTDTVRWAANVLQRGNDRPLRELIRELVESTGSLGDKLMTEAPTLPERIAMARVSVAHGGARSVDPIERIWLGILLEWVVRVALLAEAGVPVADLAERVLRKPQVDHALAQLK